ncbi:MAG TPA: DUF2946 family protein [Azonexus sp.]|nr:DUF2946 family protein [Azonexus sp.]
MPVDFSAIAKWPNVPACYDWLSLDRRGNWRLQGERVTHRGLIDFMNRQYAADDSGRWFVQNGPQRVFVALAATPWVFRRESGDFVSHTGQPAGAVQGIYLDEEGSIVLETALGVGLLDDRELAGFLAECRDAHDQPAGEEALIGLMGTGSGNIFWHGLQLQAIAAADIPRRFGFDPAPKSGAQSVR